MKENFLELLAGSRPTPGGGAAAAYAGSVGLALLKKIVRLEGSRKRLSLESNPGWEELLDRIVILSETLERLRIEDGEAYTALAKARRGEGAGVGLNAALENATRCPIRIADAARQGLACSIETLRSCKPHLRSDALVVCEILNGAARGAGRIAFANLGLIEDTSLREDLLQTMESVGRDETRLYRIAVGQSPD